MPDADHLSHRAYPVWLHSQGNQYRAARVPHLDYPVMRCARSLALLCTRALGLSSHPLFRVTSELPGAVELRATRARFSTSRLPCASCRRRSSKGSYGLSRLYSCGGGLDRLNALNAL